MRFQSLTVFVFLAAAATAAPGVPDKPPKWEYAELTYRSIGGRPGGVGPDGVEVPATPATTTIRWVTGTGEMAAKGWTELADKLKAPALKKDSTIDLQKIQIFNFLGGEGWELVDRQAGTATGNRGPSTPGATVLIFKRRVP